MSETGHRIRELLVLLGVAAVLLAVSGIDPVDRLT